MLRTAILRLSAFAVLLVSFACCAGPSETVDPTETVAQASEALNTLPILRPSAPLTISRPPTEEELAQMEQFVRDTLPRWKVYLSGQDYYFGTARGDRGVKHFFGHPKTLDQSCALVFFHNPYVAAGSLYLSLEGKDWCENKFCLPPSGKAKE